MSDPLLDIQQYLLDDINDQKGLTLTKADATFGAPDLVDGSITTMDTAARNSRVAVTAPGIELSLNYNRLSIAKLFSLRSTQFTDTEQDSALDLLAAVNERTGAQFTADDIVDNPVTGSSSPRSVVFAAKPGSIGYYGTITLQIGASA